MGLAVPCEGDEWELSVWVDTETDAGLVSGGREIRLRSGL